VPKHFTWKSFQSDMKQKLLSRLPVQQTRKPEMLHVRKLPRIDCNSLLRYKSRADDDDERKMWEKHSESGSEIRSSHVVVGQVARK